MDTRDKEPDFVNDIGVKYWRDELTSQYALKKKLLFVVYKVEEANGNRTYLVVDADGPVYDNTSLEGIGAWLDMQSMARKVEG